MVKKKHLNILTSDLFLIQQRNSQINYHSTMHHWETNQLVTSVPRNRSGMNNSYILFISVFLLQKFTFYSVCCLLLIFTFFLLSISERKVFVQQFICFSVEFISFRVFTVMVKEMLFQHCVKSTDSTIVEQQ